MTGNKTRDGLELRLIKKALRGIAGVVIEKATNHPEKANVDGYRPCPIAASTDARKMIVPWIKLITGYQNTKDIYKCLRNGKWNSE